MWSDDAERRAVPTLVAYHDTQAARRRTDIARPITASEGEVLAIIGKHCAMCHAPRPSHEGFDAPPKGVVLLTVDDVIRNKEQVLAQAVNGNAMPLGNETEMTDQERAELGAFLKEH